jgi:Leucine-rich repeat (LRR) protein
MLTSYYGDTADSDPIALGHDANSRDIEFDVSEEDAPKSSVVFSPDADEVGSPTGSNIEHGKLSERQYKLRKIAKCGAFILLLIAIPLAIGLGIALGRGDNPKETQTTNPSKSPTPFLRTPAPTLRPGNASPTLTPQAPTQTWPPTVALPANLTPAQQELFALLAPLSSDSGQNMALQSTAQNRALAWLSNSSNLDALDDARRVQRYALATFFFSTRGENWTSSEGWLSEEDECSWFTRADAACDASGAYIDLSLGFNNLSESIPPEVAFLSNLERIDLSGGTSNKIGGSLPSEIGSLTSLRFLSLRDNDIGGEMPSTFGALILVEFFDVGINRFAGPFLSEVGNLTLLRELDIEQNGFSGTFPDISRLVSLERLSLQNNSFSGPLGSNIGQLQQLRTLNIERNSFTSIPNAVGLLTALETFTAYENNAQGPIFSLMEGLSSLLLLDLHSNSLSGTLPSQVGELSNLRYLDVSSNLLDGPIPPELGSLINLIDLQLQGNSFSGEIPSALSTLTRLGLIRVDDNLLTGIVPQEVCDVFAASLPTFWLDCGGPSPEIVCPPGACCTYCCSDDTANGTSTCQCLYENTGFDFLC